MIAFQQPRGQLQVAKVIATAHPVLLKRTALVLSPKELHHNHLEKVN